MPGCPAHLDNSRPTVLAVGVGGDCLDSFSCGWGLFGIFFYHLLYRLSFSLSLGDDPI